MTLFKWLITIYVLGTIYYIHNTNTFMLRTITLICISLSVFVVVVVCLLVYVQKCQNKIIKILSLVFSSFCVIMFCVKMRVYLCGSQIFLMRTRVFLWWDVIRIVITSITNMFFSLNSTQLTFYLTAPDKLTFTFFINDSYSCLMASTTT